MLVTLIVAVSENGVIGRNGELPWRLSADLRRFKRLTMGHHLIMGRRTYESIGRPLPGRTTIVLSRQPDRRCPGAQVVPDLNAALSAASGDRDVFVVGGAEIFSLALDRAARIYLTRVHAEIEGDVQFPELDQDAWRLVSAERHAADEQNAYDCTFEVYERRSNDGGID